MKNNLTNPCNECPFRKDSAKGWLGGETPESTFDFVKHEADFACHKTRNKKQQDMSRCRGFLLFTRKIGKLPHYNKELGKAVAAIDYETANNSNILSLPEFFEYHTLK
jgi:hypothetical protein